MTIPENHEVRLRGAWQGRISGCMLGKAVELFSMRQGHASLTEYLNAVNALPLRDYIPYDSAHASRHIFKPSCKSQMTSSLPDDDINYSVLALMALEAHGVHLTTTDIARQWLKYLPLASTFTAERAAYKTLLEHGHEWFPEGHDLGFEITQCADNPYNEWIGAQIRADVYGWVCPGNPKLAVYLAEQDAALSHRAEGIYGAVFVAALGALLGGDRPLPAAVDQALAYIPSTSRCTQAVKMAQQLSDQIDGGDKIRDFFGDMSVVHTVNNLGLLAWALLRYENDFDAAIGEVVAAGLDTDCNGATVGALWALQGKPIPGHWAQPWQGQVGLSLAGMDQLPLQSLVHRTMDVTRRLADQTAP